MPSRRRFLSSAAAATVYRLVGSAPARAAALAPSDTIQLGFVGVGIRGSQLLEEFSQIPGVNPVICADLYDGHLDHAKEFTQGKIQTTKRYEDVIGRKDLDAIVIAVPDHWHKRMTLETLSAGKHVYIEKPMTWSLDEGPEMIAAEKKSGKVLMVGSGGKTTTLVAKVRELVGAGELGAVHQVRMMQYRNSKEGAWLYPVPPDASPKTIDWDRFLGSAPKRPFSPEVFFRWRCWWEYSGGVATDLFVHLLTTMHEAMNVQAPVSVVSQGGLYCRKDGRTVPDVMESLFEYKEGFIAQISVNLNNSSPSPAMQIFGEKGTLTLEASGITVVPEPEDLDIQMYGSSALPKATRDAYLQSRGVDKPRPPRPEPKVIPVPAGPGHGSYFIESIRQNKPSRENATEGHAAAGAAHLANQAHRRGRKLKWDFATNRVSEA